MKGSSGAGKVQPGGESRSCALESVHFGKYAFRCVPTFFNADHDQLASLSLLFQLCSYGVAAHTFWIVIWTPEGHRGKKFYLGNPSGLILICNRMALHPFNLQDGSLLLTILTLLHLFGWHFTAASALALCAALWWLLTYNPVDWTHFRLPTQENFLNSVKDVERKTADIKDDGEESRDHTPEAAYATPNTTPKKFAKSALDTTSERAEQHENLTSRTGDKCQGFRCPRKTNLVKLSCGCIFCWNCLRDRIRSNRENNQCPNCGARVYWLPNPPNAWVAKIVVCVVLFATVTHALALRWEFWRACTVIRSMDYETFSAGFPLVLFLFEFIAVVRLILCLRDPERAWWRTWWNSATWAEIVLLPLAVLMAISKPCFPFEPGAGETCVAMTTRDQLVNGLCQAWTLVSQTWTELGLWVPEDKSVVGVSDGNMTITNETTPALSVTSWMEEVQPE